MKKLIFLPAVALFLISCDKSSTNVKKGCLNKEATNYCHDCTTDDGSCEFTGDVLFWYGKESSKALTNSGVQSVKYYLDGQYIGVTAANIYWTSAPNCGQSQAMTVTKTWKGYSEKTYNFEVIDEKGYRQWQGSMNVKANICNRTELTP